MARRQRPVAVAQQAGDQLQLPGREAGGAVAVAQQAASGVEFQPAALPQPRPPVPEPVLRAAQGALQHGGAHRLAGPASGRQQVVQQQDEVRVDADVVGDQGGGRGWQLQALECALAPQQGDLGVLKDARTAQSGRGRDGRLAQQGQPQLRDDVRW